MIDKQASMEEATQIIQSGETLALGGITIYRRPVAFARALIQHRRELSDITLLSFTGGIETDMLLGAGIAGTVRSCYVGLEIFGLAPMFTKLAGSGKIRIIEETEASLAFGIRAHLAGVSFMPGLGWIGTDLPSLRPDVKIIEDPYQSGRSYMAFPAIPWNVAVIHALKADPFGNALINGNQGVDVELALGAQNVIITTEEMVEGFEGRVDIVGDNVRAVVHAPYGAAPTSCHPLYSVNGEDLLRYIEYCNADRFADYIDELVS